MKELIREAYIELHKNNPDFARDWASKYMTLVSNEASVEISSFIDFIFDTK